MYAFTSVLNLSAGAEPSVNVYIAQETLCDDPSVCPIYLINEMGKCIFNHKINIDMPRVNSYITTETGVHQRSMTTFSSVQGAIGYFPAIFVKPQ